MPLTRHDFAAAMARLGPFERRPHLAVAVSGGPDSLALALLAAEWSAAQGGAVTALTVDHGLRPESAAEAETVAGWLAGRGIAHRLLRWSAPAPVAGIQAAARAARYRLLGDWCVRNGVLHLLLAHHREDQAETVLLRLGRGSGVDGLAAMAPVVETARVRLLRPLLDIDAARLKATLALAGQDWIDDPSNRRDAFARVRLRRLMPELAAEGLTPARLADTARRLGRARAVLEDLTAAAAAEDVAVDPAGWAEIDRRLLARPDEIALRVLSRLPMVVAGRDYPPRLGRLERLLADLRGGGAKTLAGCRFVPGGPGLRVYREAAGVAAPCPVAAGDTITWDGRFRLTIAGPPGRAGSVGALGGGWQAVAAELPEASRRRLPAAVRATVPALFDGSGILAVPHLNYKRVSPSAELRVETCFLAPPLALTAIGHCLV